MKKNIFILGLNEKNHELLKTIPGAEELTFHPLLKVDQLVEAKSYDFRALLQEARQQLDDFEGSVDGITTYWDFPTTGLASVLCRERDLPGPSPEGLVNCSHKFRSRLLQKEVIPRHIPDFDAFDPFAEDPLSGIQLTYPFFVKPVKSYSSVLSFHIGSREDFEEALPKLRQGVARYGEPYQAFLEETGLADDDNGVRPDWCIAEKVIGGKMCTVEGYMQNGEVEIFGLIDSHRYPGRSSFTRYQYPSELPEDIFEQIKGISEKIISATGYEDAAFNIEYFYDKANDRAWLLEINPRISQSHSDIFRKVDGVSNHKVIVDLALGRKPEMPKREGDYKIAAKFYLREFRDGVVAQIPSPEHIEELEQQYPDSIILPHVESGQRLAELVDQEAYSYRLGVVYMGAQSERELLDKFAWCSADLDFRINPAGALESGHSELPAGEAVPLVKTREEMPFDIEVIEHCWITMRDGVRLSAKVWYPKTAEEHPVPAILEYIPYRKRDHTSHADAMSFNYLAGHGLAGVRVDMRGSGESEGVLLDEYLEIEQHDGLDVLKWIAGQPWCDGEVGMIGISWGGFNSLQIAALNPPELKAIITVCSTDDRYLDDVHYMGGTLLVDNLSWASTMFARNTQPPDPEIVGEDWKEMWTDRLKGSGLWLKQWLDHQWKDEYWKHGSVSVDYSDIKIPVLAVGGWADGYSNAIFRMMEHFDTPRKGIIGPWSHMYPHMGQPGPAIGFLQETLRWWNHWLKGMYSGITAEPMLSLWLQDYSKPAAKMQYRPGSWIGLPDWPSHAVENKIFHIRPDHRLSPEPTRHKIGIDILSPLSVGLNGGKWCSYSAAPDLPHDQREEDGGALTFDTGPMEEDLNIIGAPVVELEVESNRPVAMVAIRLSDIAEDFSASRITYGVLNLTHRDSHEHPEPLEPGKKYTVRVQLNEIAHLVRKGHRIRLSISSSYWPVAWPPPEPAKLTITAGASRLLLPGIDDFQEHIMRRSFEKALVGPGARITQIQPKSYNWVTTKDMLSNITRVEVVKDEGRKRLEDIDMEVSIKTTERYSFKYDGYDTVKGETRWDMQFEREGWKVETYTNTVLTSDKDHFFIKATLDAYHNGVRVHSESWNEQIERRLV